MLRITKPERIEINKIQACANQIKQILQIKRVPESTLLVEGESTRTLF